MHSLAVKEIVKTLSRVEEHFMSCPKLNKNKSALDPTTAYTEQLLNHPQLWRGKDIARVNKHNVVATGQPLLDQHLAGRGWPTDGLVELLLPRAGIGELRLLIPALQHISQKQWVMWVNPPFVPYAPGLQAWGINLRHQLVVRTTTHADTLWAIERSSKSACCGIVLAWPEEPQLSLKDTRRLQLAARSGRSLSLLFRPLNASNKASLAEVRMALQPGEDADTLSIDILKRKGGWPLTGLHIPLSQATGIRYDVMAGVQQLLSRWQQNQYALQLAATMYESDHTRSNLTPQQPFIDVAMQASEEAAANNVSVEVTVSATVNSPERDANGPVLH